MPSGSRQRFGEYQNTEIEVARFFCTLSKLQQIRLAGECTECGVRISVILPFAVRAYLCSGAQDTSQSTAHKL